MRIHRGRRRLRFWATLPVVATVLASVAAMPAEAGTTIPVDCGADPTALVTAFASASSGDTLAIRGTCVGSLDIAKNITLAGSDGATLDAQGQAVRVITIRQGSTVTISGLTITGGIGFAGVGIHNLGNLTLSSSIVRGNTASAWGGGIYNRYEGTMTVDESNISGNRAGENGGGIYNDGTLTLTRTGVTGNNGGRAGGGLLNSSFGTATVSSLGIFSNTADYGGGIANNGLLDVANVGIASNNAISGAGMYLQGGRALVERSTISDNRASGDGGGVNNGGGQYSYWMPPVLTNVTIYGNSADGSGGGVANTGYIGNMTLVHATIAANRASSGGGVANLGYSGELTLTSSIVAGSTQSGNCAGSIWDGGYNLDDGASCAFSASGSRSGLSAGLDPAGLALHGGLMQTVALLPGSPAIDAVPSGTNGCGVSVLVDERGVGRPQGTGCDMGAFELEPDTTPPTLTVPSGVVVDADRPGGAIVRYTVSASDDRDPSPTVSCSPPSGSTFAIGDTLVSCTARDAAGNGSQGSFSVQVKGASEQVADLIAAVDGYHLDKLGSSLRDKLVTVQRFLAAGKPLQARDNLAAFVSQVESQRGKGLTDAQADALKSAAQQIANVIGP